MGYKRSITHVHHSPPSAAKRLRPTPPNSPPSRPRAPASNNPPLVPLAAYTPLPLPSPLPLHSPTAHVLDSPSMLRTPHQHYAHRPSTPHAQQQQHQLPHTCLSTPRRPPRMPRFERTKAGNDVVQRLNSLSAHDLIALVKDVEVRYRQLSAFEAEEIRRAQRLGFSLTCTPASAERPVSRHIQTACLSA